MNNIKIEFYRGLRSNYLSNTNSSVNNGIFFASDTKELFVGKKSYSGLTDVIFENNVFTFKGHNINADKTYGQDVDSITINLNDKLLSADQKNVLDNIDKILSERVTYSSKIANDVTTTSAVGAIAAGTAAEELKGKSFTELMDMIFFPTIYPVAKDPSISLTTMHNPQLVGTAITESSAASSFNQGLYYLNGKATNIKVVGPGTKIRQTWTPSATNIVEGRNTVTVEYSYTQGEQPMDNKGNPYGIPKPAGTLTKSATVTGVYQYKWGVGDLTNIIPLTEATSFEFTAPAEVASPTKKKHCFAIPEKYTVIRIELFNTLSNQWVNQSLSLFGTRESEMNKNPHISYTKYTRSDEAFNGESRYRITFTK